MPTAPPNPRFTPTSVGTTTTQASMDQRLDPVHPHQRGDNDLRGKQAGIIVRFTPTSVGTTQNHLTKRCSAIRFTPTSVGTTPHLLASARRQHGSPPPAWGQRPPLMIWFTKKDGSPPPAWGQRPRSPARSLSCGGSPPPAWGQLGPKPLGFVAVPVHPHQRGDNLAIGARAVAPGRFTPTSVGTTRSLPIYPCLSGGSPPPAWGQRRIGSDRARLYSGSPPPAWGQPCSQLCTVRKATGSPPPAWGQRRGNQTM